METAGKNVFDAMNLNPHVAGRYSGDFPDVFGVHVFEVKQHHLTVHRPQAMYQLQETFDSDTLLRTALMIGGIRSRFDLFERDESPQIRPSLTDDVSGCRIVRHTVDPRS